jgi:hypothetical protein
MDPTLASASASASPEGDAALSLAAWFRSACKVYAPFYRQMTIGSYEQEFVEGEFFESGQPFALAYGDVADAFNHYMKRTMTDEGSC